MKGFTGICMIAAPLFRVVVFGQERTPPSPSAVPGCGACPTVGFDWRALREVFPSKKIRFVAWLMFPLLCAFVFGTGCSEVFSNSPTGAFLGRTGLYDYSPTAIQIGNLQQFWWCGEADNPALQSQDTDTILYATLDVSNQAKSLPAVVLA